MKILVTGAKGMLGHAVKKAFAKDSIIESDIGTIDVRFWSDAKVILKTSPDMIIHLAAETDLNLCESDPHLAYMHNTVGTANMTEVARKLNIPIMYISTSTVFDGNQKTPYTEEDEPNPINHYARSKYYGEMYLRTWHKHWTIRTGWLFGGGKHDHKFVKKMFIKLNTDHEVYMLEGVYGCPTYTKDLAEMMSSFLAPLIPYGTYHCVNEYIKTPTRYDVVTHMMEEMNKHDVIIKPIRKDERKNFIKYPIPDFEVIENKRLNTMNIYMRHWKEALTEYMQEEL